MKKKIEVAVIILALAILIIHGTAYTSNEEVIKKYNSGDYTRGAAWGLGILQWYVGEFNKGDLYYQIGQYDKAIEHFDKIINNTNKHKGSHIECKARINKVLSELKLIDTNNIEESKRVIEECKVILLEEGCVERANELLQDSNNHYNLKIDQGIDYTGHTEESIQLYIELLNLENSNGQGGSSSEEQDNNEEENEDERLDEREEQIKARSEQGLQNRDRRLQELNELFNGDRELNQPEW